MRRFAVPVSRRTLVLSLARRLDQRLHVVQIAVKGRPALAGQAVLGLREATLERLLALDVARVLELAGVRAEVAVGDLEQRLQFLERQRFVDRERADDPQTHALVDLAVERRERPLALSHRPGSSDPAASGDPLARWWRGSVSCLATELPRDHGAEDKMEPAEADSHEDVAPSGDGSDERGGPDGHEGQPHDGNHADRERAAGHDRRAVHHQPHARQDPASSRRDRAPPSARPPATWRG